MGVSLSAASPEISWVSVGLCRMPLLAHPASLRLILTGAAALLGRRKKEKRKVRDVLEEEATVFLTCGLDGGAKKRKTMFFLTPS